MTASDGISRRGFVALCGAGWNGLVLGLAPSRALAAEASSAVGHAAPPASTALDQAFLQIATDGTVTVLAKHLEMGQGIWSGLAAIVAEELDADWAQMRVRGAPVDKALYKNLIFGFQTTGGSTSTANSWDQLRRAGATARAMLVAAAARHWQVDASAVRVSNGRLSHADGRQAGFGELAALAATLPVPASVVLKDRSQFRLLGQSGTARTPRLDARAKSTGTALFGIDVERPNMRYAVVQRAPRFGATVQQIDDLAARAVPGVVDVVRLPQGLAVLADNTWAAMQGRLALKVEWDETRAEQRSSAELLRQFRQLAEAGEGLVCLKRGDAGAAFAGAAQVVEAEIASPYLAHTPMEPLCSVGEWRRGGDGQEAGCEIWAGIQNQTADQAAVATILGLEPRQVVLNTLMAGGSFGRRATFSSDWIGELAQVLKATGGATPIKLMWTREDDIRGGYYRPLNLHRLRAGLAADGRLLAIEHHIVAQSFLFGSPRPGVAQRADPTVFDGHLAGRYDVADATLRWSNVAVGVPVQMYRALSFNHTTFAKEVFMDELARRSGRDALEYRLAHLMSHPRQAAVLRLAAEMAGWGSPLPAGHAQGLAVQEANNGSFVAHVAQLRLEGREIHVERMVCAIDCGIVLNPDTVRAQMESGIAFGLNLALHGGITLADGRVEQSNFHDHPVLRMPQMPRRIDIHFIDGGTAPTGVGEPGSVTVAAAVANAVARLTGQPVRALPLAL